MTFASPFGLLALGLAVPIIALHILRSRRVQVEVASTMAWEEFDRPVAAAKPWQRLRWSIPLLLQLLLVALLALALARPAIDTGKVSAEHLVVILDTSASMGATDGSPTRLASAKKTIDSLTSKMGEGSVVSVITAGAPAQVLTSRAQPSTIRASLDSLDVSEGRFDGEGASSLALGMDSPDQSVAYALVSDGGLSADDVRLLPAGTDFHEVGKRDTNLGITNVVVSAVGDRAHVQATITNSGSTQATTVANVDVDRRRRASKSVTVPGRDSVEVGFEVAGGDRIDVLIDSNDLLASDNHAYAIGPTSRQLKILQVGPENVFLDALLAGNPLLKVSHVEDLESLGAPLGSFDVAIFDRSPVPADVSVPFLAIAPPGGAPGVTVSGSVEGPVPALVRSDTGVLDSLDMSELAIASSQGIAAPAATTLVGSEQTPLVIQGRENANNFVYLGFELANSNLGLLPAFPILGDRVITTLGGADLASGALSVGDPLPLDPSADVVVISPSGTRTNVPSGTPAPELDRTGIWTIETRMSGATSGGSIGDTTTGDAIGDATGSGSDPSVQRRLAVVNPAPSETQLAPRKGLAIPGVEKDSSTKSAPVRRSVVPLVIALGCVVLLSEWWFSSRRRGVSARQWRFASMARGAVLSALVLALILPTFTRRSSQVAAVFVVDVSDSMSGGRTKALEAVRRALSEMPSRSAAGVVAVGGDARVDAAVSRSLAWNGLRVRVDGSATDLAAGLRVAAAMAPGEYARRVVLISDGRPTTGDLAGEVRRLRRSGLRLDVIPMEPSAGADVAVSSLEVPQRARPGEMLHVVGHLSATQAQSATVTLKRDDIEVDRRIVELKAGDNTVEFEQPPGQPGNIRWSASVAGPANGVIDNDIARASTRVEGRAQAFVIEGSPGESAALKNVLESFGTSVSTVSPEEFSDLSGLASNDAIVMVNVPATSLSSDQIQAIATATRDLGTGLVTVGGTASYGAGEYLGSPLEELLPVTSEIRDPKRRSKVAQVFAVDVSGSMGACHCAEGAAENSRLSSGVMKTDIARGAAVRALEGIRPNDELGVIALDDSFRWIRNVSAVGDGTDARKQMSSIKKTEGGTNLAPGLAESAKQLQSSDAQIRHIVLFTDGFEAPEQLARMRSEAANLRDSGITVSVMGTGEGAARELRAIAVAGGGRYYPGRDLNALPNLLLQETKVVSRQLIVEGDFTPERTSGAPMVANLGAAPALRGYVATTAKPTSVTHMVIGPERDPLLASWQVGQGKVTSWMSDAGARWAGGWFTWEGAPAFWGDLMRSVYKAPMGSVQVGFDSGRAHVVANFDAAVPDGAKVDAVVVDPSGKNSTIRLRRIDDKTYGGDFQSDRAGTYAVGVDAKEGQRSIANVSGVAELGYSLEYASIPPDPALLVSASLQSGGRGQINATQSFEPKGLERGRHLFDLRLWLLLFAAVGWPVAVALSRLRFTRGLDALIRRDASSRSGAIIDAITNTRSRLGAHSAQEAGSEEPRRPKRSREPLEPGTNTGSKTSSGSNASSGTKAASGTEAAAGSSLDSLLAAKRSRRDKAPDGS